MKNSVIVLSKFLEALVVLITIFLLGISVPMIVSCFIAIFTEVTVSQCVSSEIFWFLSFVGVVISGIYINHSISTDWYEN
jgi:hypothetical protein